VHVVIRALTQSCISVARRDEKSPVGQKTLPSTEEVPLISHPNAFGPPGHRIE
jgi:hypothetical protein